MSGLRGALPAAEAGPAQAVRAAGAGWRRRGSGPARAGVGLGAVVARANTRRFLWH